MSSDLPPVSLLVEGPIDRIIGQRLLQYVGLSCGKAYGEHGKPDLLERLPKYNQAAKSPFSPWLAIVDLDLDADCAPDFVRMSLDTPAEFMRFRVAVHAIEAWLMADADNMGRFLHVPSRRFPSNPDAENDPKQTLVNLVRRYCTREKVKEAMVPRERSGALVGPGYNTLLHEFVETTSYQWRPEVAIHHSDSLRRCIGALRTLKDWKPPE
jgi:hypothetical protein